MGKDTPCVFCPKPFLDLENETIWNLFIHLTSQSRTGALGGWIGFDYNALPVLFTAYGIPVCQWVFMLDKLRVLSNIASKHWNVKTEK